MLDPVPTYSPCYFPIINKKRIFLYRKLVFSMLLAMAYNIWLYVIFQIRMHNNCAGAVTKILSPNQVLRIYTAKWITPQVQYYIVRTVIMCLLFYSIDKWYLYLMTMSYLLSNIHVDIMDQMQCRSVSSELWIYNTRYSNTELPFQIHNLGKRLTDWDDALSMIIHPWTLYEPYMKVYRIEGAMIPIQELGSHAQIYTDMP